MVFFKSCQTTTDLKKVGKMPVEREVLIMSVIAGRSLSVHSDKVWPEGDRGGRF